MTQRHTDPAGALCARLVAEIATEAKGTAFWTGRDHFAVAVMDAIARVPRQAFIPGDVPLGVAYANHPQPIGLGQTISQPYIVALMTDLLNLGGGERVLEVGTGCGYQCAVLAELAAHVYSVERLGKLADTAKSTLKELGYDNADIKVGDGAKGWPEHAPYDGILVTACQDGPIPAPLIEQLAPGGRMVIPLGPRFSTQMLHVGVKDNQGRFTHRPLLPVAFVPLVSRGD